MRSRTLLPVLVLAGGLPLQAFGQAEGTDHDFVAKLVSRSFFRALLEGDIETALPLCARPVNLDGTIVESREVLAQRLRKISQRARRLGIQLKRLEVLSLRDAIRRFGPPPPRLKLGVGSPGTRVALARFNTRGAVAVIKRTGAFFRIVALSD